MEMKEERKREEKEDEIEMVYEREQAAFESIERTGRSSSGVKGRSDVGIA